jgi:hypothetical protein
MTVAKTQETSSIATSLVTSLVTSRTNQDFVEEKKEGVFEIASAKQRKLLSSLIRNIVY